jgi:hypothetical protein
MLIIGWEIATSRKVAGSIPNVIGFFSWPNRSSRIMALWSTEPLTEMSTRNIPGGKGRPARKADNLENVGASMSHNCMDLHGLLQGQLYVYLVPNAWQYSVNSVNSVNSRMTKWKLFGCKQTWPNRGTIPAFASSYWGKRRKHQSW